MKTTGKLYRFKTFRDDKRIAVLQPLKVMYQSVIAERFYESKGKKLNV